jgi:lauroyl/myristoyl acyltransferase
VTACRSRKDDRSPDEEATLDRLKQEMADRVMAAPADAVYDAA